ncbi:hypothetical protein BSKO_02527 [Bryopsis sp. KO-2023]|nr:hypothetical protein BSKO_02527 [Bryopsis sp. KO-2023]
MIPPIATTEMGNTTGATKVTVDANLPGCLVCSATGRLVCPQYGYLVGCKRHITCLAHNAGLRLGAWVVCFHREVGFFPENEDVVQNTRTPLLGNNVEPIPDLDAPFPAENCPACLKRTIRNQWSRRLKQIVNQYSGLYFVRTGFRPMYQKKVRESKWLPTKGFFSDSTIGGWFVGG